MSGTWRLWESRGLRGLGFGHRRQPTRGGKKPAGSMVAVQASVEAASHVL